ncbi:MAG: hypothetical protein AAF573_15370, partial [Bacteroidota bacterium]
KTQEDWNDKNNLKFILKYADDTDSELFNYMLENKAAFEKELGAAKIAGKIENLIYQKIYDEERNADLEKLEQLFNKVYPPKQAAQAIARFKVNYYLEKRSSKKYAEAAIDFYKKFPAQHPSELTDVAYNFYELDVSKKKYLKQGLKWTKSAIEEDPSYFNYETLGAVYYRMKKKKKARKALMKAIELAKAQNEDFSETQQLLDKVNGK